MMEKYIEKVIRLYALGLITRAELAGLIAKEYTKLWARGKLIGQLENIGLV
jgi:hypothetical protein